MKDWRAWHEAYDDPSSPLARRLEVVRRRLRAVLDEVDRQPGRLLSLCAGDGRDVIPVLAARGPVSALLVESDPELADRAAAATSAAHLTTVDVRRGDAGDPALFADVIPVDVVLLCGIFGNIEHACVREVVDVVPSLLADGGYVIWTRGGSEPDRRPEIRRWFDDAGLREVAYDGAPEPYRVGVNRLHQRRTPMPRPLPDRLFSFQ